MGQTIVIIDYAMGNIRSVVQAFTYVEPNAKLLVTHNKEQIQQADKVVFPGQGAISACVNKLKEHNLMSTIKQCVAEKPFLGICLGLQLLFEYSQENHGTAALGVLAGEVVKFPNNGLKVPHMGWNTVKQTDSPLWYKIKNNARFYSVHSYFVKPKSEQYIIGTSHYGFVFTTAIAKGDLYAVQFHPEKSQQDGLQLLKNFATLRR